MSLFTEFSTLFPYLQSVRKLKNYLSFDVHFPTSWKIPKKFVNEQKVVEQESKLDGHRLISFVSEISETSVADTTSDIQNIIKYNLDREEKDKLFQTKVNELKTIFEKQNLNKLKNLVFDYKSERITLDDDDDTEESVDEGREIVGEGQD
jgi:DNA replication protein DnaD